MSSPLARRSSGAHAVYEELRRRILALELAPGRRLFEPELSAELGVSRTPLREALRLLLAEDLLEQLPTGGMVVRPLSEADVEELYHVRAALEGLQARLAATRATPADLERLTAILHRNELLVDYPEDAMAAGHDFHLQVGAVAGNAWAARLHAQIDGQLERYRVQTNRTRQRRHAALAEHTAILAAIRSGNATLAESLARDHVHAALDEARSAIAATRAGESLPGS